MTDIAWMDRYWKEVLYVSTRKHDIKVQYLYDKITKPNLVLHTLEAGDINLTGLHFDGVMQ